MFINCQKNYNWRFQCRTAVLKYCAADRNKWKESSVLKNDYGNKWKESSLLKYNYWNKWKERSVLK